MGNEKKWKLPSYNIHLNRGCWMVERWNGVEYGDELVIVFQQQDRSVKRS